MRVQYKLYNNVHSYTVSIACTLQFLLTIQILLACRMGQTSRHCGGRRPRTQTLAATATGRPGAAPRWRRRCARGAASASSTASRSGARAPRRSSAAMRTRWRRRAPSRRRRRERRPSWSAPARRSSTASWCRIAYAGLHGRCVQRAAEVSWGGGVDGHRSPALSSRFFVLLARSRGARQCIASANPHASRADFGVRLLSLWCTMPANMPIWNVRKALTECRW